MEPTSEIAPAERNRPIGWRRPPCPAAPWAPAAIAFAAGISADRLAVPLSTTNWLAVAVVCAGASLAVLRRVWPSSLLLMTALIALGGGWHHRRWSDLASDDLSRLVAEEQRPSWVRGIVLTSPEHRRGPADPERPEDEGYSRFWLRITAASDGRRWYPASGRAVVTATGDRTDLTAGDPVELAGSLARIAGPLNPGERDPRDWPQSRGIRLELSVGDRASLDHDPHARPDPAIRWLGRCRSWCRRRLTDGLSERVAPLALALLIGQRDEIDQGLADAFTETGMAHLLAISGMHLAAMAGLLWLACRSLFLGHKRSSALVLVAVLGYATLVGWTPSIGRAAVMVAVLCAASLGDRGRRPANGLALAALVTLAINPCFLFHVGWQLSFLAVGTLMFAFPPADRWMNRRLDPATAADADADPLDALERRLEGRWKRSVRRAFLVPPSMLLASAVVWVVCLPLVVHRFHVVAPIGILLNLPLIPIVSVAVIAGVLGLALSTVWGPLGMASLLVCGGMLRLLRSIVEWGASLTWGHSFMPSPPSGWIAGFYAALAVAGWASANRWRRPIRRAAWSAVGGVGAIGAAVALTPARPAATEVEVLAVGHGLAVVIRGVDGSTSLYDCGSAGAPGVGRWIAAGALWSRRVRRLETVIVSHADADHYNGLLDLLDRFEVGRLVVPDGFNAAAKPGPVALLDAARARGVPILTVGAGEAFRPVGGVVATVQHPPRGWLPDAPDNDRSLVLDLGSAGRHLLLTGDLDGAGTAELIAGPARPVDAMLAPHHGGRSANPPWLDDWARPPLVVASQRSPRPGSSDALVPVEARGADVRRTWRDGAVLLQWTPGGIEAHGYLDQSVRPDHPPAGPPPRLAGSIGPGRPPSWTLRGTLAVVGLLVGLGASLARAIVELGASALVTPGRGIGTVAAPGSRWEPVAIEAADQVPLRGWWLAPAPSSDERPVRVVLVLHGLAEASPAMLGRAELLRASGWSVLLPDSRGCGRSGGAFVTYGAREAGDVRAWLDAIEARCGAGGGPSAIACWGRSMGAAIALRAAAEDRRIAALVLEAPFADLKRTVAARLCRLPIPGAAVLAGPLIAKASRLVGAPLLRPRPVDLAPSVGARALILCGGDDPLTPPAEARRLADAFGPGRVPEVIRVPGAVHRDVYDLADADSRARIVDWLAAAVTTGAARAD